ncbi:MAG: efflux RND transporter periplasmic adaptor subunit [Candidatus Omnitrophica bacterium]|nr:efflux RND transporter periplasmic adaptor subunit [Candidatus Omnitrophota bacterium]
MRNKKIKIILVILVLAGVAALFILKSRQAKPDNEVVREVKPALGTIQNIISTTGIVLPKNRLEIKPPVGGRIEEMLVREGERVKTGQILSWMSSTERAALLDAARGKEEDLKYWKDIYRAIPLISPIDAEVIVATTQPGQTVTTADAVVVLSDKLIVRAQVDETDIGKVKLGEDAQVTLDAYPDTKIKAKVDHIYYESQTVNNVTIYNVDLAAESIPEFFRSGMNATVNFIENSRENTLVLPSQAIINTKDGAYVLVKQADGQAPAERAVKTGLSDDKNTEIISGVGQNDTVIIKGKKYTLPTSSENGTNPFMPARRH